MKNVLIALLIALSLCSCSQNQKDNIISIDSELLPKQYLATRDSIIRDTEFGSIYVTKDTTAEMYSWLATENIDTTMFNELYSAESISKFLATNKLKMKHFKDNALEGNWSTLYVLNDKFYVYSPSDWMFNKRILVSDSAIYHFGSDDWRIESIQNVKTKLNGDLNFNLVGYNGEKIELTVSFIDDDKNSALWYHKSSNGYEYYELRTRSSEVRKFYMIVNDCLGVKCHQEFIFETPKYSELIKTYANSH